MKSILCFLIGLVFTTKTFATPACPVCTVAIVATMGIARKLGVSDSIVGLWAGALLSLVGYWTILFFNKQKWHFFARDKIIMALSIAMIGFIFVKDVKYSPRIILYFLYLDPIVFSTIIGAIIFILSQKWYQYMKKNNNNKAHFPFEKVVMPLIMLLLASYFLYFINF